MVVLINVQFQYTNILIFNKININDYIQFFMKNIFYLLFYINKKILKKIIQQNVRKVFFSLIKNIKHFSKEKKLKPRS